MTARSRVWFTLSHGIVNEVYYPSIDQANTRDLGLIVTDGHSFFSEEKRDASHEIEMIGRRVPGYRLTNTCLEKRYRIRKDVITHPDRDVLLQSTTFEALEGDLADYKVFVLLAPHIDNFGTGNEGWVGEYKGVPMLFAQRNGVTLALAASAPFSGVSCGFVGSSDGWQDLHAHKCMTWFYPEARSGNIALVAEIDLAQCGGRFTLALAFGQGAAKAGHQARAALFEDFNAVQERFVAEWEAFQAGCLDLEPSTQDGLNLYRVSTVVLKTCEAKQYPGGIVASLSIPWGFAKGDEDLGGYHLVWTRDQVEAAGALLAAGDFGGARRVLLYLMSTQEPEGHWPQNMWLDGTPFWNGVQMDEAAFPILLADALRRADQLAGIDVWPMVRNAASFVATNGPVTQQDRWEEDGGYSPFTLAVEIAGLLAAADFAEGCGEPRSAAYLRETADIWNDSIERWTYATDTELAREHRVDGYYVRISPIETADASSPTYGFVPIKNRPPDQSSSETSHVISPDALALVRFGLRSADDPRIVNTVKVVDALLRSETATGPVWHRYNGDGYGEHADGSPFDGVGIGRGWPLLAGERAHYELAAGRPEEAEKLRRVMEAQSSPGGLLPEQVWDRPDIPSLELFDGRPTGSAMPLVWAHAEYVKLLRSLADQAVFDMPPQTVQRYRAERRALRVRPWRINLKCRSLPPGHVLRIEVLAPCVVRWTSDRWQSVNEQETSDTHLGTHVADLPTDRLPAGSEIVFTLHYVQPSRWVGEDYVVTVTTSS